jgi:hypothetical protein
MAEFERKERRVVLMAQILSGKTAGIQSWIVRISAHFKRDGAVGHLML